MPRLERTAIGVSVISRGLDDHSRMSGTTHPSMPKMGALLIALAAAVRATASSVLTSQESGVAASLADVRERRHACKQAASRRAQRALEHGDEADLEIIEGEWLNYAALLVQVDRIVADLSAPLPT